MYFWQCWAHLNIIEKYILFQIEPKRFSYFGISVLLPVLYFECVMLKPLIRPISTAEAQSSNTIRSMGTTFPPLNFQLKYKVLCTQVELCLIWIRFGLRRISKSSVQLAEKSHKSRRSKSLYQLSAGRVFYVEISRKILGMELGRILRNFFGNLFWYPSESESCRNRLICGVPFTYVASQDEGMSYQDRIAHQSSRVQIGVRL